MDQCVHDQYFKLSLQSLGKKEEKKFYTKENTLLTIHHHHSLTSDQKSIIISMWYNYSTCKMELIIKFDVDFDFQAKAVNKEFLCFSVR